MEQAIPHEEVLVGWILKVVGLCALLLLLFWNPFVLRPRFWNASVVARSIAIDAALLLVGVGLVCGRRWAALLAAAITVYVAMTSVRGYGRIGLWSLVLLVPLLPPLAFWRSLVWRDRKLDLLLAVAGVMMVALLHYVAFLIHYW
jgi:hypothetical protein